MILFLIVKGIQLCKYSTARAGYHHYDTTITGSNQSRFALSTFIFFHLWQGMTLYCFYYLFNIIFNEKHLPCFGNGNWTNLTEALFRDRVTFGIKYLIIICVCFFFMLLSFIQINIYHRIRYSMLVNPILIFTPLYLVMFIMMRIGVYTYFVPSFLSNDSGIIGSSYMNIVGYIPEILIIVEILICLFIDFIFYNYLDDKIQKFTLEQSHQE